LNVAGRRTRRAIQQPAAAAYATTVALLAVHYYLIGGNQLAGDIAVVAAAGPIAYLTATRGLPAGIIALAIISLAPVDSVQFGLADTIAEASAVAVAGLVGCSIGVAIGQEEDAQERLRARLGQRLARLKGPPGYWHSAAITRTGLYVTAFESEFISASLKKRAPGIVADIGAGSGRLEFAIAPHSRGVIATEVDVSELALMEDDYRVTPVAVGATPSLPFRDASLDWVVAIETPAVSEQAWFLEECRRVIKPGGGVILMVYNARSYKGLAARLRRKFRAGPDWADLYYRRAVSTHLRLWSAAGFEAVRKRGFYWAPVGRVSNSGVVQAVAALERAVGLNELTAVSPWVMIELRKRA
jgi:SAM-dependent methyltransferase